MDKNIGKVFEDMEIIEYLGNWNNKKNYNCKCRICGRIKRTQLNHLKNGLGVKHKTCGLGMKRKDERFYLIWVDMRRRTTNPNCNSYCNYGARGISSDYYKNFIDFYDDMYESYQKHIQEFGIKNTTLDRIYVNGNYEKNNLKWSTIKEQNNNTRNQLRTYIGISPEGEKYIFHNIRQFSEEHNLRKENVSSVIRGKDKTYHKWHFYEEV